MDMENIIQVGTDSFDVVILQGSSAPNLPRNMIEKSPNMIYRWLIMSRCYPHDARMIFPLYPHAIPFINPCHHDYTHITSSTAQGGGGSFRNRKPIGEVVANHGRQSESTDGPTGGWSRVFLNGCAPRGTCPDLLTALMNMSLVLHLPRKMHLCRSSSKVPRLPSFLEMLQNPHVLLTFDKLQNPLRLNPWCF